MYYPMYYVCSVRQGQGRPQLRLYHGRDGQRRVPYEERHPRRARDVLLVHRWSLQFRRESPHTVPTATGVSSDCRSGNTEAAPIVPNRAAPYLPFDDLILPGLLVRVASRELLWIYPPSARRRAAPDRSYTRTRDRPFLTLLDRTPTVIGIRPLWSMISLGATIAKRSREDHERTSFAEGKMPFQLLAYHNHRLSA